MTKVSETANDLLGVLPGNAPRYCDQCGKKLIRPSERSRRLCGKCDARLGKEQAKVKDPWQHPSHAPRDGREFIGLWIDDLWTWNVDVMEFNDGRFISDGGAIYDYFRVLGWTPRPTLPGKPRRK